jgi:CHC2 zinc finger
MVAQQARPHQRYATDLRLLFDPELSDLEARYRWLGEQRDLDHERETRELIRLWLDDIEREWDRRRRSGLKAPAPNYGIPENLIAQLKRDVDIVQIISDDTDLRRMGRDSHGRCPLHGGDNPTALSVSPESGLWHCFTCDDGGDIFQWIMLTKDVDFPEAVK